MVCKLGDISHQFNAVANEAHMVLFPEISGVHGDLADSDGPMGCLLDLTSRDCWDPGRGHRAMPNIILLTHIPFHLPRFNVECSLWKHASWAFRNVPASLMHYTAVSRDCLWRSRMPDGHLQQESGRNVTGEELRKNQCHRHNKTKQLAPCLGP